jgi:hypothetical protein
MKKIAAIIVFLSAVLTQAQSIYVAQNTQGQGTGLDAADARSLAWLNNPANWGSGAGQVAPGTTVHLVGTLTNTLTAYGSGTAGNPITIHFEPNAMFSAPTLPANSKWITIDGLSWITIDGGSNGAIQLTDNGTTAANGGTFDYDNPVTGIYGAGAGVDHITIQNLAIQNLYQRQTNSDPSGSLMIIAAYLIGSDVTYSNLFINACQGGIVHSYTPTVTSNMTIIGCTITNYNHAVEIGTGACLNPVLLNVTITSNIFQGGDMYESPDGVELALHRNAIFMFNESASGGFNGGVYTGYISNVVISGNYIRHGFHPQSHTAGTGAMFFDSYNMTSFVHVRVFNNISTLAPPLAWSGGGGFIAGNGTDVLVANNTAVAWQTNGVLAGSGQISGTGTNVYVYNNICVSGTGVTLSTYGVTNGLTASPQSAAALLGGVWSDYNIYNYQGPSSFYEVVFVANGNFQTWQTGLVDSFSQWTNIFSGLLYSHFDPHSLTAPVQLNTNFIPLSTDTAALGNGTNLTAWGITNDFAGNPRPATGNWTIGAYQIPCGTNGNIFSGVTAATIVAGNTPVAAGIRSFVAGGGGGDITNGLLVQYKFNQSSGAATDSSGNGHTGTLTGSAGWTNGLAGTDAISFPSNQGSASDSDAVTSPAINYSGDWTMAFWVYNNSFPGTINYAVSTSLGAGVFVGPASFIWGFNDGTTLLKGSSTLSAATWYFIAITKSGGTNYQLYLNGVADNSAACLNVNMPAVTIGRYAFGNYGMNGSVEDFRIFNRVLAAGEISTLAANGPDDVATTIVLTPPTNLRVTAP